MIIIKKLQEGYTYSDISNLYSMLVRLYQQNGPLNIEEILDILDQELYLFIFLFFYFQ